MADPTFKLANLAKVQARIAKLPVVAQVALKKQLKIEVDGLVEAQKGAMDAIYDQQNNDHERLKDSLHAYENPDRAISFRVLADAKDKDGKFIGANVEQGHRAVDGTHVGGRPAFWPTYRSLKKPMARRLSKAARDAIKQEWGA